MVSSGANVIIWCYHVMLSSGMITHPFFIFPENFTHSCKKSCIQPPNFKVDNKRDINDSDCDAGKDDDEYI